MLVYILFHETNTGDAADESDGYVEAVYATEAAANAARLEAIRNAIAAGKAVYWNPDTQEETIEWSNDWRVEPHEVIESAPEACAGSFIDTSELCTQCGRTADEHED